MNKINKETGLTPTQEKAAQLLAEGKSIEECTKELKIKPFDLYQWETKPAFKAYCNRLALNQKKNTAQEVYSLYNDAIKAMKESLKSENESVRLKTAMYIIEKVEKREIGNHDIRDVLKKKATNDPFQFERNLVFNKEKYEQLLRENGLS